MDARKKWMGGTTGRFFLLGIPLIFLLLFYFYPIGKILSLSLGDLSAWGISDTQWRVARHAFGYTFYQAFLSTALTLMLGLPAAYLFGRLDFPGKEALRVATTLPFILPTVVVAAGFNAMVGPQGWLNLVLMVFFRLAQPPIAMQNTLGAILLAHVFYNTSIVIRVLGGAWAQLDPRMEDAAKTLGASPWNALRRVTLPLLLPSLVSAVLLVFLFNFTSFGVILMLGGPRFTTLEVEIYIQTMHFLNLPLASLLSLIQLGMTMLVTIILMRVTADGWHQASMPRMKGEGQRQPKRPWEIVFSAVMVILLAALLVLPVAGLVFRSLVVPTSTVPGSGQNWGVSTLYYRELFQNRRQSFFYVPPMVALRNSLMFAASAAIVSLLMGLMLTMGLAARSRLSALVGFIVLLPLGTSAVTLGLGFFSAFAGGWGLRFYPLLIPAAHALIALPFVVRVIQPAQQSIPLNLKLAAQTLGASPREVWRHIELPIMWRALMTAAIYSFTISLGEFGATSFLTRPDLPTLPIAIYRYLTLPGALNYGQALAMAVIILLICTLSMLVLDRLQFRPILRTEEN
jgi:thiamine transport system permease protein